MTDQHRILIVDDNTAIHDDFRKTLLQGGTDADLLAAEELLFGGEAKPAAEGSDYDLSFASQGELGVAAVEEAQRAGRPFALAFVDMRMPPGIDGLETIRRMWDVDEDVQAVICTAFSDHTWEQIVATLDLTDRFLILKKPFDTAEVRQAAAAMTRKWQLQREARQHLHTLEATVEQRTADLFAQKADLERALEDLKLAQARLLHSSKLESIGQLAAGVAHEINTPSQYVGDNLRFLREAFEEITSLLQALGNTDEGCVEALTELATRARSQELLDTLEEIPKALDESEGGVEQVSSIVSSMKTFAHPGQGRREPADLNAAIKASSTVSRAEWKHVAALELDLADDLPLVTCAIDEINQVLLNLIVNAAHAVADSLADRGETMGTIRIVTRHDDESVEIDVVDSGPGISAQVRDRIFDPFFTTKEIGKGTGQGLAIAYDVIVNKHGGTIAASTPPEGGTRFEIRIPLANEQVSRDEPAAAN